MRLAIVGAGTAGLSAALFLARAGHAVELFERVPEPGAVGAGILLQVTGQTALARLGLLQEMLELGARVEGIRGRTLGGRAVLELAYRDLDPRLFGLGIHRGALFRLLYQAARAEPGVQLRLGVEVASCPEVQGGRRILDAEGRPLGDYPLVIAADGARSTLRAQTGQVRRARRYPFGALWWMGPAQDASFSLDQVYDGAAEMLGFLPTGRLEPGGPPLISLFYSVAEADLPALERAGLPALKQRMLRLRPDAGAFLEPLQRWEELSFAAYHDAALRQPYAPGLVVIGDALHAMSPQLGNGANLALLDAMLFAEALEAAGGAVEAAQRSFADARRGHHAYYRWATRFLTPFFQSRSRVLGWLRDAFMGGFCRVPLFRAMMLRSLAGGATGLFSELPERLRLGR
ncbi:MAG: NAD(P)/FAD-dependent oxidoreductase [Myxococcota bacterium]